MSCSPAIFPRKLSPAARCVSVLSALRVSLFASAILLSACESVSTTDPTQRDTRTAPYPGSEYPTPAGNYPQSVYHYPTGPGEVAVAQPPASGDHVIFYSEPNFGGESFVVETGAGVEDLARLPRGRGSWNDSISSFRVIGTATVLAYPESDFRGSRLESSSSLRELVVDRRNGAFDSQWDNAISSIRVESGRVRAFETQPPRSFEPPPPPRYDRRTADVIVLRAYRDFLGRNPDADGLRSYREKLLQGGWSEEDVRTHIRRSGEARAINPDEVVTRAYREVLKREPDAAGLRHYRDLLVNHGWTIPQVRADLLRSDERSDRRSREIITKAYREVLGREPDPDGYANYERAIRDRGWGEQQIRDSLLRSPEYRQKQTK